MKRSRGTILATVITIFVLVSTLVGIPAQAQTGAGFTVYSVGFERFEDFFGELSYYSFCAGISVSNAEDFDHITFTDPNGEVILNTSEYFLTPAGWGFCADINTDPPPLGTYTIVVTYTDSTSSSRSVIATDTSFSSTTPIIISPVEGSIVTDSTPILSWEPFESPEKGPDETLSYLIEVFHPTLALPGDDRIWKASVPGNVLSVTYNFDGTALPAVAELIPAHYTVLLFAFEDQGNQRRASIRSVHFTFPSRLYLPLVMK